MSWIWLDKNKYPSYQGSNWSSFDDEKLPLIYVGIKKEYKFDSPIEKIELEFAYDTTGYIYLNDELVSGTNNKSPEEFLTKNRKVPYIYIQKFNKQFIGDITSLNFDAKVVCGTLKIWDFSSGQGGFYLKGKVVLKNGEVINISSDESWLIRLENCFIKEATYDNTVMENEYENASTIDSSNWILLDTDIKIPKEEEVDFDNEFIVNSHSKKTFKIDFPLIYASYYIIEIETDGLLTGELISKEMKNYVSHNHYFKVNKSTKFRYFEMVSVGGFELKINNKSDSISKIKVHVLHSFYPYDNSYNIVTSNNRINDLLNKCKYVVNNCSQTIYLDSPKHLEPLASCSGDYNIESLVNAFSSGDFSLSKHHLKGYASYLSRNNGVNANTSYALTFIKWLKNIYMFTGDKTLLKDCLEGVKVTLDKYLTYLGDNFLVETPRNYVFVDWLFVDGINLFSPSKNLGQSVNTMTLYESLKCASFIYEELGDLKESKRLIKTANKIKKAINSLLFDKEKGLYSEGLTTPNLPNENYVNVPENFDKTYYRKHANILAIAYDICKKSDAKKIMKKMFYGEIKDEEVQPFFLHYMFEAIHQIDVDKKYTMKVIKQYLKHVKVSSKGLPEGFFAPSPDYVFDNSHAWASSPFYSFIMSSSGLKIIEPGMKKIRLKPTYLGVDVKYVIPTPYGNIEFEHLKDKDAIINIPKGIEVVE